MVDWSIFWNNIFPGLILIFSSSIGAYFVVHRYQRKKYNKEIRDDLINQEHKVLNKYQELVKLFYQLQHLDIQPTTKIRKMISELNKRIMNSKKLEKKEKIEKEKVEADIGTPQLKENLESLTEQLDIVSEFSAMIPQFTLDIELLYKRLITQLGLKKELDFYIEFMEKFIVFGNKMTIVIREDGWGEHKESLIDQMSSFSKFFWDLEDTILTSKIKFR